MIKTFADKKTAALYAGLRPKGIDPRIVVRARDRLAILDAATAVEDMRIPPGNRLERLSGDKRGLWSIRVNDQWRICFRFENGDAFDVELIDYH